MTTSLGHTIVTSDDMVTVTVTDHKIEKGDQVMCLWKNIEHSGRNDVIQHVIHMLTLRHTHGYLGYARNSLHGLLGICI